MDILLPILDWFMNHKILVLTLNDFVWDIFMGNYFEYLLFMIKIELIYLQGPSRPYQKGVGYNKCKFIWVLKSNIS